LSCANCPRPKTVTLATGAQVCTYCEGHRHECEARHVIALRDKFARREYIENITKKRGEKAGKALGDTVKNLWGKR
jgi:hypothetical protein